MLIFLDVLYGIAFICWMYFGFKAVQTLKLAKDNMEYCMSMWITSLLMVLIVCVKGIIR